MFQYLAGKHVLLANGGGGGGWGKVHSVVGEIGLSLVNLEEARTGLNLHKGC